MFFNSSSIPLQCLSSRSSVAAFYAFSVTYVLFLPLPVLVLYLGYRRWRRQRSVSGSGTSHSDMFIYHSVAMQLNEVFGYVFFFCGSLLKLSVVTSAGFYIWFLTSVGQALFHLLTCVDRYLAVVHPIIYLGLKRAGGVRIRNISIVCVWVLSLGSLVVYYVIINKFRFILNLCIMFVFLICNAFFSISVLCVLKRPAPGDVGGTRLRVDKSKQRAFRTLMTIMGVLLLKCGGNLLCTVLYASPLLNDLCVGMMSVFLFELPSRLVLPLLSLLQAGKLLCCRQNPHSG